MRKSLALVRLCDGTCEQRPDQVDAALVMLCCVVSCCVVALAGECIGCRYDAESVVIVLQSNWRAWDGPVQERIASVVRGD